MKLYLDKTGIAIVLVFTGCLYTSAQQITYYSQDLHATVSMDPSKMTPDNSRAYGLLLEDAKKSLAPSADFEITGVPEKKESTDQNQKSKTAKKEEIKKEKQEEKKDNKELLKLVDKYDKEALAMIDQKRRDYVRQKRQERAQAVAQRAAYNGNNGYNQNFHFSSGAYDQLRQIGSTGSWGSH